VLQQPLWRDLGKHIERVTHGLSHTFQSTERADGSQHMRRIRALLAAGLDPPMHLTLLQEEIEQAPFCFMSQQATAKFGEDREIKARIGQFQT